MSEHTPGASSGWLAIDAAEKPDDFIAYLDHVAAKFRKQRLDLLRKLHLPAGGIALDVGCGTGDMILDLLERVTPTVRAVGVDASEAMVTTARARAAERGVTAEFVVGDAEAMDFPNDFFDAVVCSRVLVHVKDPARAFCEIGRVLSSGGRAVVADFDWDSALVDADDLRTTGAVRAALTAGIAQPAIGRQLRRLAVAAGLRIDEFSGSVVELSHTLSEADEIAQLSARLHDAVESGAVTRAAADRWLAEMTAASGTDRFLFAAPSFVLCACKP